MTNEIEQTTIEAEEAVLASLLIDEDISQVAGSLKPQHFYRERHRWIYQACCELYERGEVINQITVAHHLAQEGKLEDVGGSAYLVGLIQGMPTSVYLQHYASIVTREAFRREMVSAGERIADIAKDGADPSELMSRAMTLLTNLRPPGRRRILTPKDIADRLFDTFSRSLNGEDNFLSFGFVDLDKVAGGMAKGNLILVGARPEIGKSTLVQQMAEYLVGEGKTILWLSLEMSDREMGYRKIASDTGIPIKRVVRATNLSDKEIGDVQAAINSISEGWFHTPEELPRTIAELEAYSREMQLERGLDLIVVDYLQLLAVEDANRSSYERVSFISRRLKQIAMSLEIPVVAISQLNRAPENKEDKRPLIADLRDSGCLEQDADIVLLLYRDSLYYNSESWKDTKFAQQGKKFDEGLLEVRIAKHRLFGSRIEPIYLRWDEKTRQYQNYAQER